MSTQEKLANNPVNGWVVQKFGGTSIGKFPLKIAVDVAKSYLQKKRVVLVCSARSTDTKAEGTTNRLIRAAEQAMKQHSTSYDIVNAIEQDHVQATHEFIGDVSIQERLFKEIRHDCAELEQYLNAIRILTEISPRTRDLVLGMGERLSCRFMAGVLQDQGVDAEYVDMCHILDEHKEWKSLDASFYSYVASQLASKVTVLGNKVPVVTGFFGMIPGSLLSQIGRGYTDFCAALLAVGLAADELQIWKEVDGIFTADPRKVPTARLLPLITPEEAAELTYYGSEVIHPFTMSQVISARIPIRIKNVGNPGAPGTVIFPDTISRHGSATPPHPPKIMPDDLEYESAHKGPTAVTIKDTIMVININSNRKISSHGFLASIFAIFDKYKLAVDLIITSEVHVSMALNQESDEASLQDAFVELRRLGTLDVLHGMGILSLVGKHMRNAVGISGRMFNTLAEAKINIEMISQGASEINISCVIDEKNAVKALNCIHRELLEPSTLPEVPSHASLVVEKPWLYSA
ncbi:aspartate kinase [Schizosaccharomyces osmophilus]|uniref:Aspartokinase n=1 Tax=Schizosaccharomyces osmophilus TaxID=2545709 RepID=A0AAE9W7M3_9SCHI|nr:aspartate kinase [Schizosaccharomyces osmophilus]WBW71366.1 aspartate kinase [Schizosaccharomyces osmophilus]